MATGSSFKFKSKIFEIKFKYPRRCRESDVEPRKELLRAGDEFNADESPREQRTNATEDRDPHEDGPR
jgi:hypothetical protein